MPFEDGAALVEIAIAFVGTYLSARLDASRLYGIASIPIGIVLASSSGLLARETKGLPIGEPAEASMVVSILNWRPEPRAWRTPTGSSRWISLPMRSWSPWSLEFADRLMAADIEVRVAEPERRLRPAHPVVVAIFVKLQSAENYLMADPVGVGPNDPRHVGGRTLILIRTCSLPNGYDPFRTEGTERATMVGNDRLPRVLAAPRDGQAPTVAALRAALDDGACRRIDTHMSNLFVGKERVYKLKRAIVHSYADMSTLAARRSACEAELAINKILAPGLYEGVLPVVREADGRIRIDGEGVVLDWIVVMRRFPDGALLSEMSEAGTLTPALVEETAVMVASFHDGCEASRHDGRAFDYVDIVEGLRRSVSRTWSAGDLQAASAPLFAGLVVELGRLAPLIEVRREAGFVRRGHGDLHLSNVCIYQGRVTPFDALEFDAKLATTDVLYDWAFLLMDLSYRGRRDLANVAVNRYWDESGQSEGALSLVPLFMAMRAAVRMAVALERGDECEATGYLRHAVHLLSSASMPTVLVAVGGLSGSGKTTLSKLLGPEIGGACGARVLNTDRIRKDRLHSATSEATGVPDYALAARGAVYRSLEESCREALEARFSVIADATFADARWRSDIEAMAGGRPFFGLWLRADEALRVARVEARRGDASDATGALAARQVEPHRLGAAWRTVDAGSNLAAVAADARDALIGPVTVLDHVDGAHPSSTSMSPDRQPGLGDRIA